MGPDDEAAAGSLPEEVDDAAAARLEGRLAALRERTPELELLLSGAVLFALIQLVTVADRTFLELSVNLGGSLRMAAVLFYEYVKLILYTLIAAFVTHLGARAWWIALIGIDAAFPRGPRWERLQYGPGTLEAYKAMVPPVERRIVAADVFATVVFATGLAFALLFAMSVAACALFGTIAWGLAQVVPGLTVERAFLVVAGAGAMFLVLVGILDKTAGERLLATPRRAAWWRRLTRLAARVSGARLYGSVTLTVMSRMPKRRVYLASGLALVLVLGTFVFRDVLLGFGVLSIHSHRFLPEQPGAAGFDPEYYEAYRQPYGFSWTLPSLPSEVVTGPYARLFVPFSPDRVDRGAERLCPDLAAQSEGGLDFGGRRGVQSPESAAAALAARDCLLRLVTVELDGAALPAARWVVGVHPRSRARGLVAYIPTAGLTPGQHHLVVRDTPIEGDDRRPRTHHLPFWR